MNKKFKDETIFGSIERVAKQHPNNYAYIFEDEKVTYKEFLNFIIMYAKSLKALGVKEDDVVSIIMPNCSHALIMLYAINCVGAIINMIHPLSSEDEIKFNLELTKSKFLLTLDDIETHSKFISWKEFVNIGATFKGSYRVSKMPDEDALILYTGGTSGTPKGVRISNHSINFNAVQNSSVSCAYGSGKVSYCVLPFCHGYGLGVTCHSTLYNGGCCFLVTKFNTKDAISDIVNNRCNLIAGVPTLFEAILKESSNKKYDLSYIEDVFCGGDILSIDLEERFNSFLLNNNSNVKIRTGYGLTESFSAVAVSSSCIQKLGTCGKPYPDTKIIICVPGTQIQVKVGQV